MSDQLITAAEQAAIKAEDLPAFSGVKLLHIKREVAKLLQLIGREGIFAQYTTHDISHVNAMLQLLDWVVPADSKPFMTPADWLTIVLATYFHDLGLLVTTSEFESRYQSDFPAFRDKVLFGGDDGDEYRAKVTALDADHQERFLYQEFVRAHHAARIKDWILGRDATKLGNAAAAAREVNSLLTSLDPDFRRDLALLCESHHLSDLDNLAKYKPIKPYGNSDAETVNLHYSAILLRTIDLLHITRDRTPSIHFCLINPTDPVSQEEWAKQHAVKRLKDKSGVDSEGHPDERAPRDTIVVYATFERVSGFFGLTSYLNYAEDQIRKCHGWSQLSRQHYAIKHVFPWRSVDQTQIQATGFVPASFRFTIDERKILDLLTGHTLYNDTDVVIRELAQNSIDAVRLQFWSKGTARSEGFVHLHHKTAERLIIVTDNGTGMSQRIIEDHLLKVGSSRYQDSQFKEEFPDFAPISRFGIGVLSTFMIADEVEIVTVHPDDEHARHLTLRSVHGKYLIRLLDKETDRAVRAIGPHGTAVRLHLRSTASIGDLVDIARKWIVVPATRVTAQTDEDAAVEVGYESPKQALVAFFERQENRASDNIKVVEFNTAGITAAFAVLWSPYFKEWEYLQAADREEDTPIGTCIEGVRVLFETPGYDGRCLFAVVNCSGIRGLQTNVARSNVDWVAGAEGALRSIYDLYCQHVMSEFNRLQEGEEHSLTWMVEECRYLAQKLMPAEDRYRTARRVQALHLNSLRDAALEIPAVVIEREGVRCAETGAGLRRRKSFWTVDSPLFRSAEAIIREAPASVSLSQLQKILFAGSSSLPDEDILCGRLASADDLFTELWGEFEIDTMNILMDQRRLDCRWGYKASDVSRRWFDFQVWQEQIEKSSEGRQVLVWAQNTKMMNLHRRLGFGPADMSGAVQIGPIEGENVDNVCMVSAYRRAYILLNEDARGIVAALTSDETVGGRAALFVFGVFVDRLTRWWFEDDDEEKEFRAAAKEALAEMGSKYVSDFLGLVRSVESRPIGRFSPDLWIRAGTER